MKKKIAIMLTVVTLSVGTFAAVEARAGIWDRIIAAATVLFEGEGIPCWSAYEVPYDCTGRFVECASCTVKDGVPTGGQGKC